MTLIIHSTKKLTEICMKQNPNSTENMHNVFFDYIFPQAIVDYAYAKSVLKEVLVINILKSVSIKNLIFTKVSLHKVDCLHIITL